jgi:hypothetical protein
MTLAEGAESRMSGFDASLAVLGPERLTVDHRHYLAYGRVLGSNVLQYICTTADHHGVWLVNRGQETAGEIGSANTEFRCEPLHHVQLSDLLQRIAKVHLLHGQGDVPGLCEVALERHTAAGLIVPEYLAYQLRLAGKTSVVRAEDMTEAITTALAELVKDMLERRKQLMM